MFHAEVQEGSDNRQNVIGGFMPQSVSFNAFREIVLDVQSGDFVEVPDGKGIEES